MPSPPRPRGTLLSVLRDPLAVHHCTTTSTALLLGLDDSQSPPTDTSTAAAADRVCIPFPHNAAHFSTTIADYVDLFRSGTRDFIEEQGTVALRGGTRELVTEEEQGTVPVPGGTRDFVNEEEQGTVTVPVSEDGEIVLTVPDFIDIPPAAFKHISIWIQQWANEEEHHHHGNPSRATPGPRPWYGSLLGADTMRRTGATIPPDRAVPLTWEVLLRVYDVHRAADYLGVEQLPTKLHHLRRFAERLGYAGMTELEVDILGHRKKRGDDDDEATRTSEMVHHVQTGQVFGPYTDEPELDYDNVMDVMRCADKFGIPNCVSSA
ncbi:hypothetical protein BV898_02062 [Hypsibius exemplaris]|uniref:Uncharacterized protein n=1 Tax=Hypsibius exemplaris TaxID=2072580 RepID=A0A1W0X9M8_HYPEX|nr:hypothetical protein BV898_02062 [Hypsibius exemplaris]